MPSTVKRPRRVIAKVLHDYKDDAYLDDARAVCWGHPRQPVPEKEKKRLRKLTFAVVLHPPEQAERGTDAMAVACVYDQNHTCFPALMVDNDKGLLARLRTMLGVDKHAHGYFVEGVAVNPSQRGQRLCHRLMRKVVRVARQVPKRHPRFLYLTVEVPNPTLPPDAPQVESANAARRCYQKAGFRVLSDAFATTDDVGTIVEVQDNGHVRHAYAMAMRVQPRKHGKTMRRDNISRQTKHTSFP